jgi:aminopeptidase N
MNFIFTFFFLLFVNLLTAQTHDLCYHGDQYGSPREKNIRPLDLQLEVTLVEKLGRVDGRATYLFEYLRKEIDTVFFDGIQMNVKNISINGSNIKFKSDSAGITMFLPENRKDTSTLVIEYSAYPVRGIYFLNWNNPDASALRQIWTQGQGIDNRHWIPGYDDVSNLQTVTTKITFNDKYPVVSNGKLLSSVQNPNKTKTWTYQINAPHALYLNMIAAGDYKFKSMKSKGGIQIDQYYYPNREHCFDPTYEHSEDMMDWFESEIGVKYPWGTIYRNVPTKDFLYGAMENTSSTIFSDYMHQDKRSQLERAYIGVNAHELAHQWFGDLITERSAPHHWLHESFATHYSKKYLQSLRGQADFDWARRGELLASFNAGKANTLPIAHSASGSPRHYPKGSFVLDMMRNELGNENYRKSIKNYLNRHYHQNVETQDLVAAIYETTGRDLQWFFDQWIHRGGEPELTVDFLLKRNVLELFVHQTHPKTATVTSFRMPMNAKIYYKSGKSSMHPILVQNDKDVFTLKMEDKEEFDFITVDENMDFLRKISYSKGDNYDAKLLNSCSNPLARVEAVERLAGIGWPIKKKTLMNAYHRESSAMVKKEILSQVNMYAADPTAADILFHGLSDTHHLVRRAAISGVNIANDNLKPLLIEALSDSSYINIEQAFDKLYLLYPDEKVQWLQAIKGQEGINHNLEIIFYSKTLKMDGKINPIAHQELKKMTSESADFRTRIAAINILGDSKIYDDEFVRNLIQGVFYFHPGIRAASIQFLNNIRTENFELFSKVLSNYPFEEPRKTQQLLFNRIHINK